MKNLFLWLAAALAICFAVGVSVVTAYGSDRQMIEFFVYCATFGAFLSLVEACVIAHLIYKNKGAK